MSITNRDLEDGTTPFDNIDFAFGDFCGTEAQRRRSSMSNEKFPSSKQRDEIN